MGGSQEQAGMHTRPRFVTPDSASSHLHAANGPFGGIVGPGDERFGLEGTVVLPILAQSQEQVTQLFHGRTWLLSFGTTTREFLPEGVEALAAIRGQEIQKGMDFIQDPEPFFGKGFL